jgi:hypothetical protein
LFLSGFSHLQVLLDRGLDEQHRDNAGWGPLHYAAFEGVYLLDKIIKVGSPIESLIPEPIIPEPLISESLMRPNL